MIKFIGENTPAVGNSISRNPVKRRGTRVKSILLVFLFPWLCDNHIGDKSSLERDCISPVDLQMIWKRRIYETHRRYF
jgi:hypothetical protein